MWLLADFQNFLKLHGDGNIWEEKIYPKIKQNLLAIILGEFYPGVDYWLVYAVSDTWYFNFSGSCNENFNGTFSYKNFMFQSSR
jgi:hypothetical protein